MEIDWQNFTQYVAAAGLVVTATGLVGAAAMQMVKEIWKLFTEATMPAEVMGFVSALVSLVLSAYILQQTGVPTLIALCACICAVFTPKIAHDATRYIR